jgi:DNA-binding MarR family transcriptional regulator
MILPLEKIGVVRREAHERDARSSYVTLTKSGKELFEDVVRWNEEKCEAMFSDVSDKTIKTASDLLRAIA